MNKNQDGHHRQDEDRLIDRLEANLQQIETDEILKGMTREELEARGFVGDKDISVERASFRETTEKEKLVFEGGVEYERLDDHAEYGDLDIEKLLFVKDVKAGQVIATREQNETVPFNAGNNVEKGDLDGRECFRAMVKGKVVILRDTMHVFPSDIDCTIDVRVSNDTMYAFMDCAPGYGDGKELTSDAVIQEMERLGVLFGIQEDAIRRALDAANERRALQKNVTVAEGRAPRRGADAEIEYGFHMSEEKQSFKILEDGRIDYKGSANIPVAQKGQLLATVKKPDEGVPGMNVLGQEIPAEGGGESYLVAGTGVRAGEDNRSFYAEVSGCIILNPPVIEVLDIYEVKGDVDYSTGSIDFNGSVIISGTVREGFEVKASGDIVVQKCVEAARVLAGRDVRVMGGVQGHGKGLVSAGRDVYAEFAQNARIEAQGTVYINDFAVNSYIFCKYANALKGHGSMVGGEVYAQRGMDVLTLGSPSGTKTYVTAGSDYLVKRKIAELEKVMEFCRENIKKIDTALKPVLAKIQSRPQEMQGKSAVVEKTLAKRKALEEQLRIMKAKRGHLGAQLNVEGVCFVKVSRVCYADVYVTIKGMKMHVARQRENVRFYEDPKEGEIKVGAY
ncbi:MAG: DUF342 domain-containing protein [Chitinivibrionales bacterium]|nr:DUF342 domain-containing protein [Chitinivibrionales bacterium]MBD3396709.1 DUF342 domain-containing protein [Chitinivibrionales bacterium]